MSYLVTVTVILGSQKPAYEWVPSYVDTSGPDAVAFAKAYGLLPLEWQEHVLRGGLGESGERSSDGKPMWSSNEVCVICGRQNGKGFIIEARQLAGVFIFGEELILHSAHQQRTSNDAFLRMTTIIESHPDLDAQLAQTYRSKGEEGFTFHIKGLGKGSRKRTCRLRYMARSGGAGRGFTKANCIILDEAMILDSAPVAALLPTMATQEVWQVWYFASQGDIRLPTSSVVLGNVRDRGYAKDPGLAMYEWAAHLRHDKHCPAGDDGKPTCVIDVRADPRTWAKANPSMGRLISQEFLRKMIVGGSMAMWDADREFLGVGEYPTQDGWMLVTEAAWASMYDPNSKRGKRFSVGISVSADQSSASVAIASLRQDGCYHWELLKTAAGTAWVADYCRALLAKRPSKFVIDRRSPIANEVEDAVMKRRVLYPSTVEYPAWCAKILQLISETHLGRHLGQAPLTNALRAMEKREHAAGVFTWQRYDTRDDITPFDALTLANGGVLSTLRRKASIGLAVGTEDVNAEYEGREARVRGEEPAPRVPSVAEAGSVQIEGGANRERWTYEDRPQEHGEESRPYAEVARPQALTRHAAGLRELIDRAMAGR